MALVRKYNNKTCPMCGVPMVQNRCLGTPLCFKCVYDKEPITIEEAIKERNARREQAETKEHPGRWPVRGEFDPESFTVLDGPYEKEMAQVKGYILQLEAEVKRLQEFEWMYKELCK